MSAEAVGLEPEALTSCSDESLLHQARSGSAEAFGELWRRHLHAALTVAGRHRGRSSPEDIVASAATKVLALLRSGAGPDTNFRAYFLQTVRSVAVDRTRQELRDVPLDHDDLDHLCLPHELDWHAELDPELVRDAFNGLTEGDRQVLWHTVVEGGAPRTLAPQLGVSANTVSARAIRARESLRARYLEAVAARFVARCDNAECRWAVEHLGAHVQGRLRAGQRRRLETHISGCALTTGLAHDLKALNADFGALVGPIVLMAGFGLSHVLGGGAIAALGLASTSASGVGAASGAGVAGTAGAAGVAGSTAAVTGSATVTGGAVAATSATSATAAASATSATTGLAISAASGATGATAATAGAAVTTGLSTASGVAGGALVSGLGLTGVVALPVAAVAAPAAVAGVSLSLTPPVASAVAGLVLGLGLITTAPVTPNDQPAVVVAAGPAAGPVGASFNSSSPTVSQSAARLGPDPGSLPLLPLLPALAPPAALAAGSATQVGPDQGSAATDGGLTVTGDSAGTPSNTLSVSVSVSVANDATTSVAPITTMGPAAPAAPAAADTIKGPVVAGVDDRADGPSLAESPVAPAVADPVPVQPAQVATPGPEVLPADPLPVTSSDATAPDAADTADPPVPTSVGSASNPSSSSSAAAEAAAATDVGVSVSTVLPLRALDGVNDATTSLAPAALSGSAAVMPDAVDHGGASAAATLQAGSPALRGVVAERSTQEQPDAAGSPGDLTSTTVTGPDDDPTGPATDADAGP